MGTCLRRGRSPLTRARLRAWAARISSSASARLGPSSPTRQADHPSPSAGTPARRAACAGSVAVRPSEAWRWSRLAWLATRQGERKEAVLAAQRAVWLAPGDGSLLDDWRTYLIAAREAGETISPPYGDLTAPSWRQLPPRKTRYEPSLGPTGFSRGLFL